jgi:nucleotide-binding universal stress UspA family protein
MFKRILVPLDGSETAEKVLPVVIDEAECHGATVVIIRVMAPLRSSLMLVPSILEQSMAQIKKIAQNYLEEVASELKNKGLVVETVLESGPPAQTIIDFAVNSNCDLIVIGSRGETGAQRWRFGGVANKIVKARTPIPVLIVTTAP